MIHLCFSSFCQALLEQVIHKNVTDKQWIANDAWVTYGPVSVPHNIPSLAGTIGFALRKADIPGLGAFLARINPSLSSTDSDPFLRELWDTLFGCSLSAGLGGTPCSGLEVIGEEKRMEKETKSFNHFKTLFQRGFFFPQFLISLVISF